jgi:hypothetical protein
VIPKNWFLAGTASIATANPNSFIPIWQDFAQPPTVCQTLRLSLPPRIHIGSFTQTICLKETTDWHQQLDVP